MRLYMLLNAHVFAVYKNIKEFEKKPFAILYICEKNGSNKILKFWLSQVKKRYSFMFVVWHNLQSRPIVANTEGKLLLKDWNGIESFQSFSIRLK